MCTAGKRKHLWFLLRGPATYSSHLSCTSITLYTSPFTLIPPSPPYRSLFVWWRKGQRDGKREMAELQPSHRGRRGAEVQWVLRDGRGKRRGTVVSIRRRMQREGCWFLWRRRRRLTEQSVLCLPMEDMFVVLSPVAANRSPTGPQFISKCESIFTPAPHAHTCLMWKLTTYSALVRWTEMAKGSKGWKVKATRRRTAWLTGRPSRPAWILNFSRPESRA